MIAVRINVHRKGHERRHKRNEESSITVRIQNNLKINSADEKQNKMIEEIE